MLRFVVISGLIISSGGAALGAPAKVDLNGIKPLAIRVQDSRGDRWRSPEGLSSEFPKIDNDDCSRYGAAYGYPECGKAPRRRITPAISDPAGAPQREGGASYAPALRTAAKNVPTPIPRGLYRAWQTLKAQAVEKLIGQVLLARFDGANSKDPGVARVEKALRERRLAGVVFRTANIVSRDQLVNLVHSFQKTGDEQRKPLLAIEQPGGWDSSLPEDKGFNFYAAPNFVGRQQSPYYAQLLYREMAGELATLGLNMNIGPNDGACGVSQAATSPRCFGVVPSHVAAFTAAFNFAHHEKKILTGLRHTSSLRQIPGFVLSEAPGLVMMRELAKRRPSDALFVSALDDLSAKRSFRFGRAASFGAQPLRSAGFNGVIIADLAPSSPETPFRTEDAAVRAFVSGADMVVISASPMSGRDAIATVTASIARAVKSGNLPLQRLKDAANRVAAMMQKMNIKREPGKNAVVAYN